MFDLSGAHDIISMYFNKLTMHDAGTLLGGISQITLEPEISERLDRMLVTLESQDGVVGNGTMILLGDSVLYSRMGLQDSRMVRFMFFSFECCFKRLMLDVRVI